MHGGRVDLRRGLLGREQGRVDRGCPRLKKRGFRGRYSAARGRARRRESRGEVGGLLMIQSETGHGWVRDGR